MARIRPRTPARLGPVAAALLLGLAALAAPAHAQTELWSATLTAVEFTYGGNTYTGFRHATTDGALTKDTFSYDDRTVLITFIGRRHSDAALEIHSFEDLRALGDNWTLHATPAGGTTTQLAFADLQVEEGNLLVIELHWANPGVNWQAADQVALKILTTELGPPQNFAATGGERSATLTWDPPARVPPSALAGYRYRVRPPEAEAWGNWTDIPDSANLGEYEVESLLAPGLHEFELVAVNAAGPGKLYAEAEAFVESPPPPLRSDRPCAGAKWCATLSVGGIDLAGTTVTGYSVFGTQTGTVSRDTFRYKGRDYTVGYLHHETAPDGHSHTLFFDTAPALPDAEKELTLDVGGRRFQLRDAVRTSVPTAGVHVAPFSWSSDPAPLLNWTHGDTVSVRLFAPRGLPHGSRLRPAELDAGDRFRLLFVTGYVVPDPIDGTSIDAEDYNDIVRQRVKNGSHRDNPIAPFAGGFTALVSTPFVAARDNAGTTHRRETGPGLEQPYVGVPIYWLNGDPDDRNFLKRKIADDYADFHDGDWDDETHPKDEWGDDLCTRPPCAQVLVSTGSRANGTVDANGPFGAQEIRVGALNPDSAYGPIATARGRVDYDWCNANSYNRRICDVYGEDYGEDYNTYEAPSDVTVPQWQSQRLYGLSPAFEVRATAPSVTGVAATRDREGEIEVTWKLKPNGSPLTSLKIQHKPDGGAWEDAVTGLEAAARSHVFENFCGGFIRRYRVVAENAVGATASRAAQGRSLTDDKPPVITAAATTGNADSIDVTWEVEGCTEAVKSFKVERYNTIATSWKDAATGLDPETRARRFEGSFSCGFERLYRVMALGADGSTVVATSNEALGETWACLTATFASTVSFGGLPDGPPHVGAGTRFTIKVQFSEDIRTDLEAVFHGLCPALTVTNGTCGTSNYIGDEEWSVGIDPDGDADVTLTLKPPSHCYVGAVCTSYGKKLSAAVTTTVPGPSTMQSVALTAEFVADSLPANHGGASTTFTARIQFNQDADVDGLCDAVTVTDGTCGGSAKVGDDASLWELTIAPDASKPVTVALGKTTDCAATGAICTSDDTPLSTAITTTVSPPILEAAWDSLPDDHGGADTSFTAQVRFSEDVDITDLCAAFEVTNGSCSSSSKVGDDADLWEIVVAPDDAADVSLSLGFTTDCEAAGAVCTSADTPLSYGVFAVVSRRPLTVALVSLPEDHGGVDTTFTVQLRFSEAVDVDDLCEAVSLLDATCSSSARDADDADLWEVVVAPDGAADVFFVLADKDCGHADAVCTADGAPLSDGILEYVPRRPFTAAWVDGAFPTAHEGAGTEFTVRVQFSEDAHVSYLVLRDEALEVTNGTGAKFRRVDGRNDLREATIVPDGTADVTLVLDSPTDCAASDAVCTKDDSPLTTRLALSVPGPGS